MLYTVKDMSALSNVTVKTLHHYHKIGLLHPCEISDAGYRLYGGKELERLQQILFYRELDFPLERIKQLLEGEPDRLSILSEQRELLRERSRRLERLLGTLDESIAATAKGETLDGRDLFKGFQTEAEWREALAEQRQYVEETYGYDMLEQQSIDVETLNEQAKEAVRFMNGMTDCLRGGMRHDDAKVRLLIRRHLDALRDGGEKATSPAEFAAQARFFLADEFHRNMLEAQQTGLAYYLCAAAEAFAADSGSSG